MAYMQIKVSREQMSQRHSKRQQRWLQVSRCLLLCCWWWCCRCCCCSCDHLFHFFTKSRNKNLKYEPELIDAGQVHRNHPNIFSQIKPERDWNKYFWKKKNFCCLSPSHQMLFWCRFQCVSIPQSDFKKEKDFKNMGKNWSSRETQKEKKMLNRFLYFE